MTSGKNNIQGTRFLILAALGQFIFHKIHFGYLGAERCLGNARETLCKPSINYESKYVYDNCSLCQETKPEQCWEITQIQPISMKRWWIVSTDQLHVNKEIYLIISDNLTKNWTLRSNLMTPSKNARYWRWRTSSPVNMKLKWWCHMLVSIMPVRNSERFLKARYFIAHPLITTPKENL